MTYYDYSKIFVLYCYKTVFFRNFFGMYRIFFILIVFFQIKKCSIINQSRFGDYVIDWLVKFHAFIMNCGIQNIICAQIVDKSHEYFYSREFSSFIFVSNIIFYVLIILNPKNINFVRIGLKILTLCFQNIIAPWL